MVRYVAGRKTLLRKTPDQITGQVRGVARMIDDRCCVDIVAEISATHGALKRVEEATRGFS